MKPTPEEINDLRVSGETLTAIAAKAKLADELEAALEACRDDLMKTEQEAANRFRQVAALTAKNGILEKHFEENRRCWQRLQEAIPDPHPGCDLPLVERVAAYIANLKARHSDMALEMEANRRANKALRQQLDQQQETMAAANRHLWKPSTGISGPSLSKSDELEAGHRRLESIVAKAKDDLMNGKSLEDVLSAEFSNASKLRFELERARAELNAARGATLGAIEATGRIHQLTEQRNALIADLKRSRELRTSLRETTAAQLDHLQGEILVLEDAKSSLMMDVDRAKLEAEKMFQQLQSVRNYHAAEVARNGTLMDEAGKLRAENGQQAAVIAAMPAIERHRAVMWNPYNEVVQDHRDGTIIQPDTNKERAKRGLPPFVPDPGPQTLRDRIKHAINCTSAENGSDTPDFILADYLSATVAAFDEATREREKWYGRRTRTVDAPTAQTGHSAAASPAPPDDPGAR